MKHIVKVAANANCWVMTDTVFPQTSAAHSVQNQNKFSNSGVFCYCKHVRLKSKAGLFLHISGNKTYCANVYYVFL